MTFRIHMNTHVIFLDSAFDSLKSMTADVDDLKNIRRGMNVVISCTASIESYCNMLLLAKGVQKKWLFKNSSQEKIELLLSNDGTEAVQEVGFPRIIEELVLARNWLIHFKNSHLGLVGSDNAWIVDKLNNAPERDPFVILGKESCERFYEETKKLLARIAITNGEQGHTFEFIDNNDFDRHYFTAG